MKQGISTLGGLRYKLRMTDNPVSGPSYIYRDIMSFVHYTSRPESVSREKSNSVCYHAVHESVAIGESPVENILSKKNVTDLMTKVLENSKHLRSQQYKLLV